MFLTAAKAFLNWIKLLTFRLIKSFFLCFGGRQFYSHESKMMSSSTAPVVRDLVLLGGGHSHVEVLRSFGMNPLPGARVTLITKDVHTPYSGMLPGFVSGFYSYDDVHIDLSKLANFSGARLIHAEADGIDVQSKLVHLKNRPAIPYDILSINIGITPAQNVISGAKNHTTPVKPISTFVTRFENLLERVQLSEGKMAIVVVGGGAGGVELALALNYRLEKMRTELKKPESARNIVRLVTRGRILSSHISYMRKSFLSLFKERGVELYENATVLGVENGALKIEGKNDIAFDECLWCTQASAAPWLKETNLKTDSDGFILINEYLQCMDGPENVFACGDVASSQIHPRPKAGVFAVRQGPPLASNLRHFLLNEPLEPFTPQKTFLSLISAGNKYCVGSKGWVGWQGERLWNLKDHIDRKFMYKYGKDLPEMNGAKNGATNLIGGKRGELVAKESAMRCGGCGGKVGWDVLGKVLDGINGSLINGFSSPEDAAIIPAPPPGCIMIQTVDFLKAFTTDPFEFGMIAAHHCLSDIYAMGGKPSNALAVAVVPFAQDGKMQSDLEQVMFGVWKVLEKEGCTLSGGHTSEGSEMSIGLFVHGTVKEGAILKKSGMKNGNSIILTKPLGTGTLLAAAMRGKSKGRWLVEAMRCMKLSNARAAELFQDSKATACTDVTGYGLLGHLAEMVKSSKVCVEIDVDAVPVLEGAESCLESGIFSSIERHNENVAQFISNMSSIQSSWKWHLLLDPQTSGGLLASVPVDNAENCVNALKMAGYEETSIIGRVVNETEYGRPIKLVV